ncbi:MAG: DUF2270 domain-containing protein, partial [Gemmatimonadota bacterium]|nr:DUF2270 domain-containing protein [Gemmatimonadota bacterium]
CRAARRGAAGLAGEPPDPETRPMDPRDPPPVLIHLYRAAVGHADIWRQRLDATTNWAVITTAAVLTFAFSGRETPHFVMLLALLFVLFFLFMETRRYQAYNLWQRRIRVLHRALIVPALRPAEEVDEELVETLFRKLADDFATWLPALGLRAALGYRLRRNYVPLITLILVTWLLKLYVHPEAVGGLAEYVGRASVGLAPGAAILGGLAIFYAVLVLLALSAPSEQMVDWSSRPSPIDRIRPGPGPDGQVS